MIFITLGSQKFQFNRLLKAVDELVEKGIIKEQVFAQSGYSDYKPQYYRFKQFLDRDEFIEMEDNANIVITHGGTGVIVGAVKKRKKVIAIPRLAMYGEHVDDHQLQIVEQFKNRNLICGLNDCDELRWALDYVKDHVFNDYNSNTMSIIANIERFIEGNNHD